MSEYDYEIWQGDSDEIVIELTDKDGPANLTGTTITAIMEEYTGSPSYEIACTGDANGFVTIPITATETEVAGSYKLRIPVTADGTTSTWPSGGPIYIKILEAF